MSESVDDPATLQSRLEAVDGDRAAGTAEATIRDPVALLHHLDASGRFHRDGRLGRLYHRGMISLRENVLENSLHVSVDGNTVTAHVDQVSPLAARPDGASAYSLGRAVAHNLAGMAHDLLWLLRGRQGDHRCELDCEWVADETEHASDESRLLDPTSGAWSVQLEARVAGALDEARLRAALAAALGPHPPERAILSVVDCADDDALHTARGRVQRMVVALDRRPPLHACLARHPAGDVLMLGLNHAATDGFGALEVLRHVAQAYAGDADRGAPLEFLASRDLPVRPAATSAPAVARLATELVERLRDIRDRPARLSADEPGDDSGCGFHLVALSAAETRHVVGTDRSRANTNILMAALHLAIGDWNDRHGATARRIGTLVHADLRPAQWREQPIGNFSVTARMSTRRRDRHGPASALRAITAQIARNKRTRTGVALIAALERAGLLTLWAKQSVVVLQPVTGNHRVDTTVLCNLGWLDEAPSFGPDAGETLELWFSTPARSPLSLCLGAVTIGGRLHLTFRYPHRLFGRDAARRFAECYLDHLRQVGIAAPDRAREP